MKEFSVQQFSFRPWSNEAGLFPVLAEIAEMGYTGVEMCCFAGFESLGMSASELKRRMADLGLKMVGNHFTRAMFQGSHEEAFQYIAEAGGKYAIYNVWGDYNTEDDVAAAADYLNSLAVYAKAAGITLLYHNHAAEFATMNGKYVIDRLADALDPAVCLETDVFFAKQMNADVYGYLQSHADRIRTVHLKQIDAAGNNVDLPDGILDMAEVIRCAPGATDYILEQSSFAGTIRESLKRNADFLKTL